MTGKDEVIADYKERLHLNPPDRTAYSKLTHSELRGRVSDFTEKLRKFNAPSREAMAPVYQKIIERARQPGAKQEDFQRALAAYDKEHEKQSQQLNNEYQMMFRGQAIALRDEMFSRLPAFVRRPTPTFPGQAGDYESVKVGNWIDAIAGDLDRLAKLLPERRYGYLASVSAIAKDTAATARRSPRQ